MELNTQHDPSVQEVNNASNDEQTLKHEQLKSHDIRDQSNTESQHEKTKEKSLSHDKIMDQSNNESFQHEKTKEKSLSHDKIIDQSNNESFQHEKTKEKSPSHDKIMDQSNNESFQHEKTKEKSPSHDKIMDQSNNESFQHEKTKEKSLSHDKIMDQPSEKTKEDDPDSVDGAEEIAVDFILVWEKPDGGKQENVLFHQADQMKRNIFEENLKQQGLVLNKHYHGNLCFVTVYTPRHVLLIYADIMKLRMPLRSLENTDSTDRGGSKGTTITNLCMKIASTGVQLVFPAPLETDQNPIEKSHFTAEYVKAKHYLFHEDHSEFLSTPTRSQIVDFILSRESYSSNTNDLLSVGIQRLVEEGVYKAAYPLHDGDYKNEQGQSLRYTLYEEWAKMKNLFKPQPADQIKQYLGVKCAFYFLWLEFYTRMLILASVLGFIVIFYGLFTLNSDTLSRDICNKTLNIIMCPLCDKTCPYWKLSEESCGTAKITYLFDNTLTVVFAFLMSIWTVLFLELWKRYSACLTHHWDLSRFTLKAEHPRPNYFARVSRLKRTVTELNSVTGAEEQTAPVYIKWPTRFMSFSVVLLFMAIALFVVLGVILFKMYLTKLLKYTYNREWMNAWGDYIIQLTVLMNLLGIIILNYIFDKLSLYMTELEYMRTQTEFDESLTTKRYLFQFSNYYSGIIYIAFLKGKFVGYPGHYLRIFGARQEECSAGGCLWDLFCYLAVFLTLQQVLNALAENLMPFFLNIWKAYRTKRIASREYQELTDRHVTGNCMESEQRTVLDIETTQNTGNIAGVDDAEENPYALPSISTTPTMASISTTPKTPTMTSISTTPNTPTMASVSTTSTTTNTTHPGCSQWHKDFNLNAWGTRELFPEYLEMIIQYGFVVLFITAFPLAPLLALINNIFETRLDAQKFLKYYRRPVPHRATNIGIWYQILDGVAQLAVISNAIIIAFNSNFVPRMVYRYVFSPDGTDEGFLNHSLAFFNTSDFNPSERPNDTSNNVAMCRYSAYRNPPWVTLKYNRSQEFWIILVARLVFIILFQTVVSLSMNILKWLIPDVPATLKNRMKREEYLTSELMIDHETKRAANKRTVRYAWNNIRNRTDASSSSSPATSGGNKLNKIHAE